MSIVDEAISWFESRRDAIDATMTYASVNEGEDNGGRAVQLDLDNDRVTASAFFWECGWCHLEAIELETDAKLIDECLKNITQPIHSLLDRFLEQLNCTSH